MGVSLTCFSEKRLLRGIRVSSVACIVILSGGGRGVSGCGGVGLICVWSGVFLIVFLSELLDVVSR